MIHDIFNKIKVSDFAELCNMAKEIDVSIDDELLIEEMKTKNKCLERLQERWEESLRTSPDYSVYGEHCYLNEAFVCWKTYSRRYLKLIKKYISTDEAMASVKSIVDLGCGIAYSTLGLKEIFPNADVYGTNMPGTLQYQIDAKVCDGSGCVIVDDNLSAPGKIEMVVAFEFFEHIVSPVELLLDIIRVYSPKYIVFANTFNNMAIGHFNSYKHNGMTLTGRQTSRLFGDTLRNNGYSKVNTGFFNNRPCIYRKTHHTTRLF